jgi:hypothetical protein
MFQYPTEADIDATFERMFGMFQAQFNAELEQLTPEDIRHFLNTERSIDETHTLKTKELFAKTLVKVSSFPLPTKEKRRLLDMAKRYLAFPDTETSDE